MSEDEEVVSTMITSAQAAALCGMTAYAFRKAMLRQEMLISAKIKMGNMYLLDQEKVLTWNKSRRKRKTRS